MSSWSCDATGGRAPGHDHAIAGIECKSDAHHLVVLAGDFKTIRRPTQVGSDRNDLTIVGAARRLSGVPLQQKPILCHQLVKVPVLELWKPLLHSRTIQQCSDPAVTISRRSSTSCRTARSSSRLRLCDNGPESCLPDAPARAPRRYQQPGCSAVVRGKKHSSANRPSRRTPIDASIGVLESTALNFGSETYESHFKPLYV